MVEDRRSWLDRLLGRPGKDIPPELIFQPAGTEYEGVAVPLPFAPVPGSTALDLIFHLHRTQPDNHAVLLAAPEDLEIQFQIFDDSPPSEETLARAAALTIAGWRAEKAESLRKIFAEHPEWSGEGSGPERGPWPEEADPQRGFSGVRDVLSGKHHAEVLVALSPAPVARWWETAAHLRFGGWNECPDPAVHVMLHRIWAEKYGARLVTMAFDTIELQITKPICTRAEALEVAQLQYEYCNDIIDQGAETLENHAASLIDATSWFFWWD